MRIISSQRAFYEYFSSPIRRYSQQTIDFDKFLTDSALEDCVRKFSCLKGMEEWKHLKKEASILLPLCHVGNDVCLLYTLRTNFLKRHSGQVSFPGGIRDGGETLEETALRECEEEIGIPKETIKLYGCGSPVGRLGIRITPVIGYIGILSPNELRINPNEVQCAFALPLRKFCDKNNCRYTRFKNNNENICYTMPVYQIDGYRVWGITAYVTHVFLKCLLNQTYQFNINSFYIKI